MASRKNFMGHMNRRHRDMSAAHITALMQQRFAILDCHCGHHCISRTGLLMHLSRCQVPRPEGWDIPPRHPLHHDEPLPQLAPLSIPPVAVQPEIINYEDLLYLFRQPVYKVHHTWKAPMATIVEALLGAGRYSNPSYCCAPPLSRAALTTHQ